MNISLLGDGSSTPAHTPAGNLRMEPLGGRSSTKCCLTQMLVLRAIRGHRPGQIL